MKKQKTEAEAFSDYWYPEAEYIVVGFRADGARITRTIKARTRLGAILEARKRGISQTIQATKKGGAV